jgi:hypothetical protein
MLKIKNMEMVMSCPKNYLATVDESADGMVFQFKNGTRFVVDDPYLPAVTKSAIRMTLDSPTENVTVDMRNYSKPITIENC